MRSVSSPWIIVVLLAVLVRLSEFLYFLEEVCVEASVVEESPCQWPLDRLFAGAPRSQAFGPGILLPCIYCSPSNAVKQQRHVTNGISVFLSHIPWKGRGE